MDLKYFWYFRWFEKKSKPICRDSYETIFKSISHVNFNIYYLYKRSFCFVRNIREFFIYLFLYISSYGFSKYLWFLKSHASDYDVNIDLRINFLYLQMVNSTYSCTLFDFKVYTVEFHTIHIWNSKTGISVEK